MKNAKKIISIVLAMIMAFSVLTFVSAAADVDTPQEIIPSYSPDDLTYNPSVELDTRDYLGEIKDQIGGEINGDALEGIGDTIGGGVSIANTISQFFQKAIRAFIELFDHIADLLFPAKK